MSESTLSLGECARRIGVSKGTISKAIASGKLSATRREDHSWSIDGAELARYVEVNGHRFRSATGATTDYGEQPETPDATVAELAELKARAELAEARLSDLRELCSELRQQRDKWETVASRLSLSDQKPPKAETETAEVVPGGRARRVWRWLRTTG